MVKPHETVQTVMRLQGTPQSVLIPHETPECEEPEPFQIDDFYCPDGTHNFKKAITYIQSLLQKNIPYKINLLFPICVIVLLQ